MSMNLVDLPRGTVTFLFTDIESSTRLWHEHAAAMPGAYARHDRILRDAVADEGGVVFKTIGDAFQIVFPTAIGATIAALRAQHALQQESWETPVPLKVRMALHTGAVDPAEDGDYRSPVLNRLGRLQSAGHGGQVLVSQATMELARDHLPAGAAFRDLGEQRLKDLYRPERVFQLEGSGIQKAFPPLRTLDSHPNNLPTQLTQFIGRQDDVRAVRDLLLRTDTRLVTLTGPGGIGKTRLSLQVAADVLESFEDGVFLATLDTLTDATLVPGTIAAAFGLREESDVDVTTTLRNSLRDRNVLIVLDNLEQVIYAAVFVSDLLVHCPRLSVLATSRVRLQIGGEQEYAVQPLALPRTAMPEDMETVSQYESVRLFIERARLVKPEFTVSNENAPAIAGICVRLDGLPLAIELAAARIRMLPPEAMLRRLTARLPLLTGGARDLPLRQQTLRGAIAWSYELLSKEDRALFRRMSVFAGGATLEAIEAVAVDETDFVDVFSALERLVDQSLVRQTEIAGEPRFSMYETIREFGLDELRSDGESAEAHRRHALFFTDLASGFRYDLDREGMAAWLDRMEPERDNVRAAGMWSLDQDVPIAWRLLGNALRLWMTGGPLQEGKTWLERVLTSSREHVHVEDVARMLRMSATFTHHERGIDIDIQRVKEAHHLYRELGDRVQAAMTWSVLSTLVSWHNSPQEGVKVAQEAVQMARSGGDLVALSMCLNNEGYKHYMLGDLVAAERCFDELLGLVRRTESYQNAFFINSIGDIYRDLGRLDDAEGMYRESLVEAYAFRWFSLMSFNLMGQVNVALDREQWERAATLGGGEVMIRQGRDLGGYFDPDMVELNSDYERGMARVMDAMGTEAYRAAWSRGASMSLDELMAEAVPSRQVAS